MNNKKDRWSRHGLGHLLNPTDPEASDRDWTAAVWGMILRKGCGLKTAAPRFAHLPAIGRTTVSSPFLMRSFETLNAGKPYAEQIKRFNFLATAHLIPFGHPEGVDPEKFHLITPYDSDSRKWLEKEWIDQHSKKRFRIATHGQYGTKHTARVKTYGDVVTEYEFHLESKCADALANPCDRQTIGLLKRRHIKIDQIKCIGKESNSLGSVDESMIHSEQNVYTEYADPKRTEWITKIQSALKKAKLEVLVEACGKRLCRREIIELRAGSKKPHRRTQQHCSNRFSSDSASCRQEHSWSVDKRASTQVTGFATRDLAPALSSDCGGTQGIRGREVEKKHPFDSIMVLMRAIQCVGRQQN